MEEQPAVIAVASDSHCEDLQNNKVSCRMCLKASSVQTSIPKEEKPCPPPNSDLSKGPPNEMT